MMKYLCRRQILTVAVLALAWLALEAVAHACPTCRDSLAANDPQRQNLVRGYYYSILFMVSMPFLIFSGMCGYFYYEIRKARRAKPQSPA